MNSINPMVEYKKFKKDKIKNANIIVDLLKDLESLDIKKIRKTIAITHRIFCQLMKDGDIKETENFKKNKKSPKVEFENWLFERYKDLHEQLLALAINSKVPQPVQLLSLTAVIKLLQKEVIYHINIEKIGNLYFPLERLKNLYNVLLLNGTYCRSLITRLKEYLECPDFLFASLFVLTGIIPPSVTGDSPFFLQNVIDLLSLFELPKEGVKPLNEPIMFSDEKRDESLEEDDETKGRFDFPFSKAKQYFNSIWEAVLKMKFSPDVYKRCLIILPEKVMTHLDNPVRLTDFFMCAYIQGGEVSILAMHGVFILITEYNLEYPDFYEKVYALLQPSVFNANYKERFFKLLNRFFLSPYLPEYIVAAFIKKFSRLTLTAPSPCLPFLMKFVINLLFRFPSLKRLINRPNITNIESDPYLADEPNLQECKAGESSLWEIAALKNHPLYGISKAACFLDRNFPEVEHDISKSLNDSYEELYTKASKIQANRVATTFYKPESILKYSEDLMDTWKEI